MRLNTQKVCVTLLAVALCLGTLFCLPSLGNAEPLEKVSIQLKWFHQFQFAGYYAAKEKGFYAEEGLDVEFIERNPKTDPVDDVVNGRAEYGISDAGLLISRLRGKPVVMMAQIFQYSPLVFVTLRESGLRAPTDLIGKRVMTDDLGNSDASLKAMILKSLGHLNKVQWQPHTYQLEDLVEKRTDAMLAYSTNEPFWFHEQGIDVNIIDPRDYGVDFYGDNLFTTENEIKLNPDRVEKVRRASLKGWKYALEHKDELIDLILKKYNTQKWTKAHLQFEATQTHKIINPRFFDIGHFEHSRYQKIAGIYTELSIADRFTVDGDFYYSALKKRVVLTPEEKAWVENHTIKVGVEQWAPIVFSDKANKIQGLAGGFLNMISKSTGLKFEIVADDWNPLLKGLKNKTIDLLPATYYTDERATYGLYTAPYFHMREFIYVKDGETAIKSLDDLADKRIAVVKGYGTIPKIRAKYPKATIVETKDLMASIDAVLNGKVHALMESQMAVEHTIKSNSISGLRGISQDVFKASPVHFVSRMDEPILQSILQKGLSAITEEERRQEMGKWVSSTETERDKLRLTPVEQSWLSEHETIRLGVDKSWAPFEFVDEDGNYAGVSSGYVDAISKRLEISMQAVPGIDWSEVIAKIKVKELDVLTSVARTPEREDFLNFTKPYIKVPIVIATLRDGPVIGETGDLEGKTVGVVKGYAAAGFLHADHPSLKLVEVADVATLLKALSAGKVDAVVESLWSISYEKDRQGLDDVKIAVPTPYNYELSMGVRKDWPELVPILDKALVSLNKKETTAIKNTWLAVQVEFGLSLKTILTWAVPIGTAATIVIMVIVVWNRKLGNEIDERKNAERKLQLTQYAVDHAAEEVFWIRPEDGGLDYVNNTACTKLGYTREELLTMSILQIDIDFPAEKFPKLMKLLADQRFTAFESRQQKKNGDIFDVEVRVYLTEHEGREILIANTMDITERKAAAQALAEAKEKAEEATKAKATFLATMSHEIRTPMGGVIGMVDILKQTKVTDDQRQMINTVGDSANSLLTIINDILDFSKIEAGKLDLEEIPVSIRDVVEGAGEALAVSARNKNIGLNVYVDPDIPDALLGDQVRLRQILFNFGTNAIKFTEQGNVFIRADHVPSQNPQKATVRLSVIDDGIGIPKEAQAKLFQAFSQVEASTTRRFGGTGLGLTICQRLTEIMHGEIGVESVVGEGSTFSATIEFPIATEHDFKSDGHDLNGLNILLVHQDDDLRKLLPRYLEHWKADVTTTAKIDDAKPMALDAVQNKVPFDVICLGSDWPSDEQIDFVRTLQADKTLSSVRYVITCAGRVRADRKAVDNTVYVDAGPLRRADFIKSIAVSVGRASPEAEQDDDEATSDAKKAPSVDEAEAMGQLILLAEDNITNQDVIRRQLTMLGYALEIANDGKEALELLESRSFAILLTDCHMPNMDGFELTQTIRKSEQGQDIRFPIVAVTASVMKEEVDQCFASGMDDFIAKPMVMKKLKEKLYKWMPVPDGIATKMAKEPADKAEATPATDKPSDAVVNVKALTDMFGDDEDMLKEILGDYVQPSRSIIGEIDAGFEAHDADAVGKAAHKLKSSSRAIGANSLADLCDALELAGKANDWGEIEKLYPDLHPTFDAVITFIEEL